jgi:hypothetical protein
MPLKLDKNVSTSLSLSPEAIGIIDRERGQQSRSSFVNSWLISAFGGGNE